LKSGFNLAKSSHSTVLGKKDGAFGE
jgi:hypothetical protein